MTRYATIDIGTNSLKMNVAEVRGGQIKVLDDLTEVTRLGEELHETGLIGEAAFARNVQAISSFVRRCKELQVDEIAAVGTMALRNARNTPEFVTALAARCGVTLEVIPGEEEARLSYLAILSGMGVLEGRSCIFDTGGGSTEFIFGEGERIDSRFSLNVGSRRPTGEICRSDPVTEAELGELLDWLSGELKELDGRGDSVSTLIGMGGTVTSLGSVMFEMGDYDPDRIQGATLPLSEVERQIEMFRGLPVVERARVTGLIPKRADVILAGAAIVGTVIGKIGKDALTISDRGLRHGLMFDRFTRPGV